MIAFLWNLVRLILRVATVQIKFSRRGASRSISQSLLLLSLKISLLDLEFKLLLGMKECIFKFVELSLYIIGIVHTRRHLNKLLELVSPRARIVVHLRRVEIVIRNHRLISLLDTRRVQIRAIINSAHMFGTPLSFLLPFTTLLNVCVILVLRFKRPID